jgi:hypothetical protein
MDLSSKFLNGLSEKYHMDIEDIKDWIYCGGNHNQHYNYYKLCYPDTPFPEYNELCICNTKILYNCYIRPSIDSSPDEILIVGSCCIEKFLPNGFTRFCEKCNEVHKRIKYNICFKCEKKETSPYVYFDFSYSMKDSIKAGGAKWDDENELWRVRRIFKPEFVIEYKDYIIDDVVSFVKEREQKKIQKIEDNKLFSEGKYTTKFFTFANKDNAKDEGYQWDKGIKKWWKAIR